MQLGVIADDFTGATDIASFLVRNGMPTVQLNGVPTRDIPLTSEAVVISLKTRSCPAEMAVSQSLAALRWLQAQGCQQFYLDGINNSGLGKVWFAGRGIAPSWQMKRDMLSPAYTTRWRDIPVARIG